MKMFKKVLTGTILAGAILTLAACGQTGLGNEGGGNNSNGGTTKKAADELNIGVSISTTNNPYFVAMDKGIKDAAEKAGTELNV